MAGYYRQLLADINILSHSNAVNSNNSKNDSSCVVENDDHVVPERFYETESGGDTEKDSETEHHDNEGKMKNNCQLKSEEKGIEIGGKCDENTEFQVECPELPEISASSLDEVLNAPCRDITMPNNMACFLEVGQSKGVKVRGTTMSVLDGVICSGPVSISIGQVPPPLGSLGKRNQDYETRVSVVNIPEKRLDKSVMEIKLPLNSLQELSELEMGLDHDPNLRDKLLHRLAQVGGKNYSQSIRLALKVLLSDSLALDLNWAGRGGSKKAFQSYIEVKSVLFDAVRHDFPKVTDFELKYPVQCWLKRSRRLKPALRFE